MITMEQAISADVFHYGTCKRVVGPRGGVKVTCVVFRRNGQTQTWKTRPEDYRVPVKRGMYEHGEVTPTTAPMWHTEDNCLLNAGAGGDAAEPHDAFIQERYLFADRQSGKPDMWRFICSCGKTGENHFARQHAVDSLLEHRLGQLGQ